jgi:hypothetical protein
MGTLRYLHKTINLLNILLLAALCFLVFFAVVPLFQKNTTYVPPAPKPKTDGQPEASAEKVQTPSPVDYAMIGENNLFHPERRIPPEKKEEKPLPKPELVLFGTVISDDGSFAYIEDKKSPRTTPGRGPRQSVVKKGDVVGGFILKEIRSDKILLSRGEETMVVNLLETGKQRSGEATSALRTPAAGGTMPSAVPTTSGITPPARMPTAPPPTMAAGVPNTPNAPPPIESSSVPMRQRRLLTPSREP